MRIHLRWKLLSGLPKLIVIIFLLLSVIAAAYYTHSTFSSSQDSADDWRRKLGRAAWHFLHTTAAQLPDKANITATHLEAFRNIFRSLEVIYPCDECREHLVQNMKLMRSLDTVIDAPSALMWTCELHNIVNKAQKKQLFPCDPEILAKKWSNPNCGCRSKKNDLESFSNDPSPSLDSPSQAISQSDSERRLIIGSESVQARIQASTPDVKAQTILRAQAKLVAEAAAMSKDPHHPSDFQDSPSIQHDDDDDNDDAHAEPAQDIVELPDGEEAAGD
jgi:hypothetical protein